MFKKQIKNIKTEAQKENNDNRRETSVHVGQNKKYNVYEFREHEMIEKGMG